MWCIRLWNQKWRWYLFKIVHWCFGHLKGEQAVNTTWSLFHIIKIKMSSANINRGSFTHQQTLYLESCGRVMNVSTNTHALFSALFVCSLSFVQVAHKVSSEKMEITLMRVEGMDKTNKAKGLKTKSMSYKRCLKAPLSPELQSWMIIRCWLIIKM